MLIQAKRSGADTLRELYVVSDEEFSALPPQCRAKHLPRAPRGGPPILSAAEVLTILGWGRGRKDKAALSFHLQTYHRQEFPALGGYSQFSSRVCSCGSGWRNSSPF